MKATLIKVMGLALPLYAVIWFSIYKNIPETKDPVGLKCLAVACLLTLVVAIENVSRERLFSTAIDPIHGQDTTYMKFAQRLLASSVEQFIVFAMGAVALSQLIEDQRVIITCTITWILSRYIFWFAYSKGSQYRAAGLVGMIQSYAVLAYACYLISPLTLALFAGAEALITYRAKKRNAAT